MSSNMKATHSFKLPQEIPVPEYAKVLRYLREKKNWSQKDVGKRLHLSPMSISYYENGHRFPDLGCLEKWAGLFNLEVNISLTKI